MPAYLIVNYDIVDPELYGQYAAGAGPAMKIGEESELVAMDPDSTILEGDNVGRQTIVLRIDSKEKAIELRDSGAYQAIIGKRLDATANHFCVLINGIG